MALSLSFDDGRESQVTQGLPVFARHAAKVTLYVVPSAVERHLEGWKQAAAAGHEIGNHSLTHSCSGNFAFSRQKALEDHSLARMRAELRTNDVTSRCTRALVSVGTRSSHVLGVFGSAGGVRARSGQPAPCAAARVQPSSVRTQAS